MSKPKWFSWFPLFLSLASATANAGVLVELKDGEILKLSRHEVEMRIDGVLDENVWDELPYYDQLLVTSPDTLVPGPFNTRIRVFFSSKGLYASMESEQPASTILQRLSGRDTFVRSRDSFAISLDTSGTGRYGYFFELYLGDSVSDGTVLPERQISRDWDGPWRGATARTENGWSAEILIPWGTVAMPISGETRKLGIAFTRSVGHLNEMWQWPPLPFTKPQFMSGFLPVEVTDIAPRQQYNFYPYSSVTLDGVDDVTDYRVGADLFWRPSTNFQLNATLNPDFGAVESDDVVINLSATETFFPEKRLFFLEGQQIFQATPRAESSFFGFGPSAPPYSLVNTRRIGGKPDWPGLPADWRLGDNRDLIIPVDLDGAVKATGQLGSIRYGVLGAFEDTTKFDVFDGTNLARNLHRDGNDYGVARVLWENNAGGEYRALGILSTAVMKDDSGRAFTELPGNAYTNGIDWHYYTQNSRMQIDGQVFTSDIDGAGLGYGGFMDLDYSISQGVTQSFGVEYMDEDIDLNDLGFLARNSHYEISTSHRRSNSNISWGRTSRFGISGAVRQNLEHELISSSLTVSESLSFDSLDQIFLTAGISFGAYDDLNSFGNGTFRVEEKTSVNINFNSNDVKQFSYGIGIGYGEEALGGNAYSYAISTNWRPTDQLNFRLRLGYRDRDGWLLHQGGRNMTTFKAEQWTPTLDAEYFISAKQQFRISLQWVGIKAREQEFYVVPLEPGDLIEVAKPPGPADDFSVSQLSFQARYRWELAPLSDLFVVYTRLASQGAILGSEAFEDLFDNAWNDPIGDSFVVKFRYRLGS
jgi:hypothetical protein